MPDLELHRAIARAKQFLLNMQSTNGSWFDYSLEPGPSEAWVTAVVGLALAKPPLPAGIARPLQAAADLLHRQRKPTGWGYNLRTASDGDSTSWALQLLCLLDDLRGVDAIAMLVHFLSPAHEGRTFSNAAVFGTWAEAHSDVTPVIGMALHASGAPKKIVDELRSSCLRNRSADGLWKAFWWRSQGYASARCLEFLEITGGIPLEVRATAQTAIARWDPPHTAFDAAQNLVVAVAIDAISTSTLILDLLRLQTDTGGWPPSTVLRVPEQIRAGASDSENLYADDRGLMTTAMSVLALCKVAQVQQSRANSRTVKH
jgi:hypothetical protein